MEVITPPKLSIILLASCKGFVLCSCTEFWSKYQSDVSVSSPAKCPLQILALKFSWFVPPESNLGHHPQDFSAFGCVSLPKLQWSPLLEISILFSLLAVPRWLVSDSQLIQDHQLLVAKFAWWLLWACCRGTTSPSAIKKIKKIKMTIRRKQKRRRYQRSNSKARIRSSKHGRRNCKTSSITFGKSLTRNSPIKNHPQNQCN